MALNNLNKCLVQLSFILSSSSEYGKIGLKSGPCFAAVPISYPLPLDHCSTTYSPPFQTLKVVSSFCIRVFIFTQMILI